MNLYQPSQLKRHRRTKAELGRIDAQILEALHADHPQSVRHVFYLMTDPRLPAPVEKTEAGYDLVQRRCVTLRRAGILPYDWIADATRRGYRTPTFSTPGDFVRQVVGHYRADLWAESDVHVEVWCESRSIASVLVNDCRELAVGLFPCAGFSSLSFAHDAAQQINHTCDPGKEVQIIYIGDFDPAGVLIDLALKRELRQHLDSRIDMVFTRIAIEEFQIAEYELPGKPRKTGERRVPHIRETVEAEAMPAHILRQLVRDAIMVHLKPCALRESREREMQGRARLLAIARDLDMGP